MARIGIADFLKKRLGSSASRDPRVTWSGTFGTESSRKKQENRLADQPSEVGVTARKRKMPISDLPETPPVKATKPAAPAKSAAPKPAASKPKGPSEMQDFMGSLDDDNAVLKKLRERGFKKGGNIKSTKSRGDGCITKGGTKGRYV